MGTLQQVPRWITILLSMMVAIISVSGGGSGSGSGSGSGAAERRSDYLEEILVHDEGGWIGSRGDCGIARRRGHRPYQEDRAICMPQMLLPGPGGCIDHGFNVGLFGVFDGHNGAEASELASNYLPHLLRYHTWFILTFGGIQGDGTACPELVDAGVMESAPFHKKGFDKSIQEYITAIIEQKIHRKCGQIEFPTTLYEVVLKEALSRVLFDIDSAFSSEFGKHWSSGTTAVVVLKLDKRLLVANIGDSKAFICSSFSKPGFMEINETNKVIPGAGGFPSSFLVKELTVDHHPDRLDEKNRIEAAGGFVSTWDGVARVNGQLAVSRAIGDVPLKRYGVIAEPDFMEWENLTAENLYLVITSDGIFETMKPEDVCSLLHVFAKNEQSHANSDSQALADFIVDAAFRNGSFDNLAAVVYPLKYTDAESDISQHTALQILDKRIKDNAAGKLVFVQIL